MKLKHIPRWRGGGKSSDSNSYADIGNFFLRTVGEKTMILCVHKRRDSEELKRYIVWGRRLMVLKIKFYEFSNQPCLLAEVMVKDFLLLFFTAVVFRKDLIP